jgi:hypothetical protein
MSIIPRSPDGERYTPRVPFACPGCGAPVSGGGDRFVRRCPSCGALLRSRPAESGGPIPAFDVEVAGRPETRRRVELPWDEAQRRRLFLWLALSTTVTLGLVLALLAVALFVR